MHRLSIPKDTGLSYIDKQSLILQQYFFEMKKLILAAIIAAAALAPATVDAKSKKPAQPAQQAQTEQCRPGNDKCAMNPFEGLDLTAEQQTALKALCDKQKAGKDKKDKTKAGSDCQGNCTDSCKTKPADRLKKAREHRAARLAEIQKILTPEQYVKFLENNFVNAVPGRPGDKMHQGRPGDKMKGGKRHPGQRPQGPRGQRPQGPRGDRPAPAQAPAAE